jgi:hypothetical protein
MERSQSVCAVMPGRAGNREVLAESRRKWMPVEMTRDVALQNQRGCGVEIDDWPISRPLHGEGLLALVHVLATSLRKTMLRWSSRSPSTEIRVPPMTLQWLRTFEDDYDKHRAEP